MNTANPQNTKVLTALFTAALLVPFIGLAEWRFLTRPSDADDQLALIVQQYGYHAVTPPSRLFGPGTITTVETLQNGTLQLHPTCIMDEGALAAMWHKSPTINRSLVSAVKNTFDSSANTLSIATSGATGKRVEGIDVSLRNINIVTMPYEALIDVRNRYLKGACESVVIGNLRAGSAVCQSEEVLEADLVYRQDVQNGFGGNGKADGPQAGGSVNVNRETSAADERQGEDLFLGARVDNSHCFRLDKDGQNLAGSF